MDNQTTTAHRTRQAASLLAHPAVDKTMVSWEKPTRNRGFPHRILGSFLYSVTWPYLYQSNDSTEWPTSLPFAGYWSAVLKNLLHQVLNTSQWCWLSCMGLKTRYEGTSNSSFWKAHFGNKPGHTLGQESQFELLLFIGYPVLLTGTSITVALSFHNQMRRIPSVDNIEYTPGAHTHTHTGFLCIYYV